MTTILAIPVLIKTAAREPKSTSMRVDMNFDHNILCSWTILLLWVSSAAHDCPSPSISTRQIAPAYQVDPKGMPTRKGCALASEKLPTDRMAKSDHICLISTEANIVHMQDYHAHNLCFSNANQQIFMLSF